MRRATNPGGGWAGRGLFGGEVWRRIADRLVLSPRELQIAQGVCEDELESAIARRLGISAHTVHTHLGRLYQKLGVRSRVELVVRLVRCHNDLCRDPRGGVPPLCARRAAGECPFAGDDEV